MNCEACPFNNKIGKVYGEGSRITKEYFEETFSKDGKIKFRERITERDNTGQYDVVCVAMAPAREEMNQLRPLVGVSGQILRRTLERMGVTEYYLTNIFLCPIIEDSLVPQALNCCRDVIPEILERKPKLVIALGDLPLHQLANLEVNVREVEGRVLPSKVGPLLPLTHPAYYWRRPNEFFDFPECMRSGVKFLSNEYEQCVTPTYTEVTPSNMSQCLNELDRFEEIAVDTETRGLFAYGWNPGSMLEMGLAGTKDHAYIVPEPYVTAFKKLLEEKKLDFWNAPFDCAFLRQKGIKAYPYFDGMVAHYSIDERPYGHGLKKVARIYLGADEWDKDVKIYLPSRKDLKDEEVDYGKIPTEKRYEYLSKDVTRTRQLKDVLVNSVNEKIFWSLLMPAQRMFIDIQERGMRINPMQMMELHPILEDNLYQLEQQIYETTKVWLNPNSPKQVQDLLYNVLGYPVDSYLGPTTSKNYLIQFRGDPIIDYIMSYREISKTKNTYIEGFAKFVDRNFRIHPTIKVTGSETGRLSSENPSIMNIKLDKRLKSIFLAEEGRIFLYFDIKGNELRWYGITADDQVLLDILRSVPTQEDIEEAERLHLKGPICNDPHHQIGLVAFGGDHQKAMEYRTGVKGGVFGTIYKRGLKSMEMQFGAAAPAIMKAIFSKIPKVHKYYEDTDKQMKEKGYLESFFGRRRHYGLITPESWKGMEREGINFRIQSPGSDTMLYSMLHIWNNRKKWDIWPFWPVHDSITMDGPAPEIIPEVKKEMEEFCYDLVGGKCPFVWEADTGIDWAMTKPPWLEERWKKLKM